MDPRQVRTREKLFATVLDLAAEAPVSEITVTEVARSAGVHRSTLYEHATSPGDLLRQALLAELDELRADLLEDPDRDTAEAMSEVTRGVLEHVRRHADTYRRGLAWDAGDGSLHGMLSEHFLESIRQLDQQRRLGWPGRVRGLKAAEVKDAASRSVAQGTVGAIQAWLETPALDVRAFLRLYPELVPEWWGTR
jgi:AcrR family transcriptional regulator